MGVVGYEAGFEASAVLEFAENGAFVETAAIAVAGAVASSGRKHFGLSGFVVPVPVKSVAWFVRTVIS